MFPTGGSQRRFLPAADQVHTPSRNDPSQRRERHSGNPGWDSRAGRSREQEFVIFAAIQGQR